MEFKDLSLKYPKEFEPELVSVADDESSACFYEPNTGTDITVTVEETGYSIERIADEVHGNMYKKIKGVSWSKIQNIRTWRDNRIYSRKVKEPDREYFEIVALYRINKYLYTMNYIIPPDIDQKFLNEIITVLWRQY
ncbi:MAG: hypothetical protein Q4D13_01720 [Erysipelotrichaceae bacterium]|nr:hypothetical protein [Erysipelotrichaceae bacterium]